MNSYKSLDVWKASVEVVKNVYLLTKNFPKEELFALTSQCKRAAVSITANIAEGMGRQYKKDTLQFLHISRGSLYETESLLIVAAEIEILDKKELESVSLKIEKAMQVLNGFIGYLKKNANLK